VNQIFAHSKVMIVDDCWAIMGSANLDGVSLHSYGDDFAGPLARRAFRDVRNFDVNVVIRDGIDGVVRSGTVAELRVRLWAEHLGLTSRAMSTRPAKGWLNAWRDRAKKNVAALDLNDSRHRYRGFVLPYSAAKTPAKQLRDLGIRRRDASAKLKFNPGWAEVYLSPNWIRNMFL
jgi:phosphatidylserine/phosphatidylglycerophosphate/cardiolipin synthase-like enzyme